ncbi:MAG: transglycosylase SLT domain-containing protein [Gammaproteobacteria bacterium]|jgi:peptidoglycan hydrolase-like protein with peptidoglycan-binding domain
MYQIKESAGKGGVNNKDDVFIVQTLLNRHRKSPNELLAVDKMVGPKTIQAIVEFQMKVLKFKKPDGRVDPNGKTLKSLNTVSERAILNDAAAPQKGQVAWGAKVSTAFKNKVVQISNELGITPDFLMACMAFETGETFSPSIKNAAGSGATGLIQFMPRTAKALGTTVESLSSMTDVQQLDYVKKYFLPQKGKLKTLEDVYLAILYPAAIGTDVDSTLFEKGTVAYKQNVGFDKNKDGIITPAEVAVKVRAKYEKGLKEGYAG